MNRNLKNIFKFILLAVIIVTGMQCRSQRSPASQIRTLGGSVDSSSAVKVQDLKTLRKTTVRHDTYIAFDSENNSYSFDLTFSENYGYLFVNEAGGGTRKVNLLPALQKLYPKILTPKDTVLHALGSITIDKKDRIFIVFYLYDPFSTGRQKWKARMPVLLYSDDHAQNFTAYNFPGNPDLVFLEKKLPFENNDYPPLIGYTKSTGEKVSPMSDRNEYGMYIPEITDTGVSLKQLLLTHFSPGISTHTGGQSFASTFGNVTTVVYNEIPSAKNGNNIIEIDFDRQQNKIIHQQKIPLIVKSKYPYPDPHVTPVIVTCSDGEQHILVSPQAGDCYDFVRNVNDNFNTEFEFAAQLKGPRVYTSSLRDDKNNIYVFYDAYKPKPGLYVQKYDHADKTWGDEKLLATPPTDFSAKTKDNFGIYYFKAAIDNKNEIYLSFTFFNTYDKTLYPRYLYKSVDLDKKWNLND